MSDRRFAPEPFDTPAEAAYWQTQVDHHNNHAEDVRRDPAVDGTTDLPSHARCRETPCNPYCWGPDLAAAYKNANGATE